MLRFFALGLGRGGVGIGLDTTAFLRSNALMSESSSVSSSHLAM